MRYLKIVKVNICNNYIDDYSSVQTLSTVKECDWEEISEDKYLEIKELVSFCNSRTGGSGYYILAEQISIKSAEFLDEMRVFKDEKEARIKEIKAKQERSAAKRKTAAELKRTKQIEKETERELLEYKKLKEKFENPVAL